MCCMWAVSLEDCHERWATHHSVSTLKFRLSRPRSKQSLTSGSATPASLALGSSCSSAGTWGVACGGQEIRPGGNLEGNLC